MGLVGVLCFCALFGGLRGSAIPMWEFLSKQEKTSYIYSLFAHQVEKYCEGSTVPDCNRRLLKFGSSTLRNFSEEKLDSLDPYQRGANNIIWEALMQGHALMRTTPRPKSKLVSSTTAKPNSYEDDSFGDYDVGSQSAASVKFDNVYVLPPPKGFVAKSEDTQKKIFEDRSVFDRFQNQYRPVAVTTEKVGSGMQEIIYVADKMQTEDDVSIPLTGPMVVKVFPDGSPVKESTELPQDEDLRQYKLSKVTIPNL